MGEAGGEAPEATGLVSRHCRLRPVLPADYDYLYRLLVSPDVGARWRFRGASPSPHDFPAYLGHGVLVQFVADQRATAKPIGLVSAYNADFANQHAWVAMALDPSVQRAGWPLEALLLFIEHTFSAFSFRKLYFEVPAFNLGQFASAIGRALEEEGRLRDHEWYGGAWWDRVHLSLTRERWACLRARYRGIMSP